MHSNGLKNDEFPYCEGLSASNLAFLAFSSLKPKAEPKALVSLKPHWQHATLKPSYETGGLHWPLETLYENVTLTNPSYEPTNCATTGKNHTRASNSSHGKLVVRFS